LDEAGAVGQWADAEHVGQRLPEIRKGGARADVGARLDLPSVQEHRHVLSRMIGARRRRIVAVVGGNDEEIIVAQLRQHTGQARVEPLKVRGVAGGVVAMAVDRVEIHQVGEDQTTGLRRHQLFDAIHAVRIALGRM
jgi:hypothetical protein